MNRRARAAVLLTLPVLAVPVLGPPVLGVPSDAVADPCAVPTITGTDEDDVLHGTAGIDVIAGLDGDDEISGLGGDDVLCGGPGSDRLSGGDGADRLHGGTDAKVIEDNDYYVFYGDTLVGGPGDDLLDLGDDPRSEGSDDVLSYVDSTSGVVLDLPAGTAIGEGADQVVGEAEEVLGSDHDDVLVGTDEDQELVGYGGSDHVEGGGGDDEIVGASPYDVDSGESGDESTGNLLVGGPGDDRLTGSDGDDVLRGGPGADAVDGGAGLDRLRGGPGRDRCSTVVVPGEGQLVAGGPGRDQLEIFFSRGGRRVLRDAVVRVDLHAATGRARSGTSVFRVRLPGLESVVITHGERWFVRGTDGPNRIGGSDGVPRVVRGLGGDDHIFGSFLHDVLDGERGYDLARGYGGDDRYVQIERILPYPP